MKDIESKSDPSPEEDRFLLERTAGGDEDAFVELYQRHHRTIFNYLLRLVREVDFAEELLQEVFVAAWRGAGRFRGQAMVKTWLFRIAHNQAVSWLRRHKKTISLQEDTVVDSGEKDPEKLAEVALRADQVHLALDQLSPKHRAVVELAFVGSFSYAEIAQILDCPVGTVKSRMSYALRYLAGALIQLGLVDEIME